MTHNGPLVQQFERELAQLLGVKHVVCVANGTCALQLAIRALDLSGEIITTPFTYIATANIIRWERCTPVFCDIDPETWNLDVRRAQACVTEHTSAILPVHVFSAPCDVNAFAVLAAAHGLRLIYDAAHAMAVDYGGRSLLAYGDVSCTSFHATKLLTTAEGGACVTEDDGLAERLRRMRFFGFDEQKEIVDLGMNAKMTEVHAAIGLANLRRLDAVRARRAQKAARYRDALTAVPFLQLQRRDPAAYNNSYLPVLFDTEERLLGVDARLRTEGVLARRYFYPSLNTVPILGAQGQFPVAESVARRVLCLPLYDTLPDADIDRICDVVARG